MRVYYQPEANTVPTFFVDDQSTAVRPDEQSFTSLAMVTESPEYYYIAWSGDTPTLERKIDADDLITAREKEQNAMLAALAQNQALRAMETDRLRKNVNLPPTISTDDVAALDSHIQLLQGDIDNPAAGVYNPPLPPGVVPPPYKSFTITVTRQPGWEGKTGFKVVLNSADADFAPDNMALAVYTNANCQDFLYTTGAFVEEGGVWGAVCPAGHEPGNVEIHFGILYGSAPMLCWSMPQGQDEITVTAFEES